MKHIFSSFQEAFRSVMPIALSIGVSASVGISMLRILFGIPILPFLIVGYTASLFISFFVPTVYTGITSPANGIVFAIPTEKAYKI